MESVRLSAMVAGVVSLLVACTDEHPLLQQTHQSHGAESADEEAEDRRRGTIENSKAK